MVTRYWHGVCGWSVTEGWWASAALDLAAAQDNNGAFAAIGQPNGDGLTEQVEQCVRIACEEAAPVTEVFRFPVAD